MKQSTSKKIKELAEAGRFDEIETEYGYDRKFVEFEPDEDLLNMADDFLKYFGLNYSEGHFKIGPLLIQYTESGKKKSFYI